MRASLFAALALGLSSCGECDSCKKKDAPPPAGQASAGAPAAPGAAAATAPSTAAVDALVEPERKPPQVQVAWRGEGTRLELSVWEMHCEGCELRVEEALKALPGVAAVKASHKDSSVTVTLSDAAQRPALIEKIRATLTAEDFRILGE